jgi:mannose-1-phosphate guanylyltransferase
MPVNGRPLLDYWMRLLVECDVRSVIVNTHTHAEIVSDYLSRPGFAGWVVAFHEVQLLGTAGTLRAVAPMLPDGPLIVAHADNLCDCDFRAFLKAHATRPQMCAVTMMSFTTSTPSACGILTADADGVVTYMEEKPLSPTTNLANAAVYVFEKEVIDFIVDNPDVKDISLDVLPHFMGRIQVWHNDWVLRDIGNPTQFAEAQKDEVRELTWAADDWQTWFEQSDAYREIRGFLAG